MLEEEEEDILNGIFKIALEPSLLRLEAPEPLTSSARQPRPWGGARKGRARDWEGKGPLPQSCQLPRELRGDPVSPPLPVMFPSPSPCQSAVGERPGAGEAGSGTHTASSDKRREFPGCAGSGGPQMQACGPPIT